MKRFLYWLSVFLWIVCGCLYGIGCITIGTPVWFVELGIWIMFSLLFGYEKLK